MRARFDLFFIAFIAFATSALSISYELLIARFLSSVSLNSVVSQSITIGLFLLALGCGAGAQSFLKPKAPARVLVLIESLLSIAGSFVLIFILWRQLSIGAGEALEPAVKMNRLIYQAQIGTFIVGFLSGFEIPLVLDLLKAQTSKMFGWVLAISYVGGLIGTWLLSLWLVPAVGLLKASFALALLTAALGAVVYLRYFARTFTWAAFPLILAVFLPQTLIKHSGEIEQFYLKSYYYLIPDKWTPHAIHQMQLLFSTMPNIQRLSSAYQDIDIVQDDYRGEGQPGYHLFLNQHLQFGSETARIYHDLMIHGSLNLAKMKPQRVLIIGGGDGLLAKELLKYKTLESITLVELDPAILNLAKAYPPLVKLNENSLVDKRVHVVIGDGFTWAREQSEQFDCVFVDLPHPHSYELSRLYSREFYLSIAKLVKPDGFMAFDFPFFALAKRGDAREIRTATSITNAVRASGFKTIRMFGFWESFLIGFKKDFNPTFDYQALDPLVSDQSVSQFSFIDPAPYSDAGVEANTVFKPHWLRY